MRTMDSASRNMFDTFKEQIWEELGPVDPNWFEELTILASNEEGGGFEQDKIINNQDGCFKTPLRKSSDSQLFSTPMFFRRKCTMLSPETEDEQSYLEKDNETWPHTLPSPGLMGASENGVLGTKYYRNVHPQDSFELLYTPKKIGHTQHISESLGVQINADVSWTSSLNTPPALPSTIILTKKEESPCPMSPSDDNNVIIVRTLFPSLSNATAGTIQPPKKSNEPTVPQAIDCPKASEGEKSFDSSLDQSGGDWRQTLPDAIEDGEIRSTVASVLEGAENVLSIFFTNSSSALRRVKPKDRIKRKQSISIDEQGCLSSNALTTQCVETCDREDERKPEVMEIVKTTTSPQKGSKANTGSESQWSPMSLSNISQCVVDKSGHVKDSATQWKSSLGLPKSDSDASQVVTPSFKNSASIFFQKRKKFVYTIPSTNPLVQGKAMPTKEIESPSEQNCNITQEKTTSYKAKLYNINNCDGQRGSKKQPVSGENLASSVQVKGQDLDMSQLCRAFAQDFTQMPDLSKPGCIDQDTRKNGFSPSACLSGLKQINNKLQTKTELGHMGILHPDSNGEITHLTNYKYLSAMSDSGFTSTVVDVSSGSSLPKDDKIQTSCVMEHDIHRTLPVKPFINEEHKKNTAHFGDFKGGKSDSYLSGTSILSNLKLSPDTEIQLCTENNATRRSSANEVDNKKSYAIENSYVGLSISEQRIASFPSISASGFKMASNRGITISSVSLDNAKCLFKDIDDGTEIDNTHESVENMFKSHSTSSREKHVVNNDSHLTDSQKADITELCCLLEEADTQFEFTQHKSARLNLIHPCPNRVDNELDPDFLAGIDFDDSFSSQAETYMATAIAPDKVTSICQGKNTVKIPAVKCKDPGTSNGNTFSHSKETTATDGIADDVSAICTNGTKQTGTNKPENQLFGVGFKTARGNALGISKKCLSKARALFADLEEIPIEISATSVSSNNTKCVPGPISLDQQTGETDGKTKHQHNMSSNKSVHSCGLSEETDPNSRKRIQVSDFKPNNKPESSKVDISIHHREKSGFLMASGKGIRISANAIRKVDAFFKDCDFMDTSDHMPPKLCVQEEPVNGRTELEQVNAGPTADYGDETVNANSSSVKPLPLSLGTMSSGYSERELSNGVGFCTASGKRVFVSGDSLTKAQSFLNECDAVEDKKDHLRTSDFSTPVQVPPDKILQTAVSMQGTPSLKATSVSSPLSRISKNGGSAFIKDLGNKKGFCTASGKKLSVSDTALETAMSLLNECDTLKDEKPKKDTLGTSHPTAPVQALLPQNSGFQTASGKGVTVSTTALKKAKALLNEFEDTNDKNKLEMLSPDFANMDPPARTIAFSAAALQKAKTVFSDISYMADINEHKPTRNSDISHENAPCTSEEIKSSVTKAEGTNFNVSEKECSKVNSCLNECDAIQDKIQRDISRTCNITTPFQAPSAQRGTFQGNPSLKTKPIPSPLSTISKNVGSSVIGDLGSAKGFCTASGKKVSVSDTALKKAMSILHECDTMEDERPKKDTFKTSHPTVSVQALQPQNAGFQTASGKGVAISTEAVLKAKALLSECDDTNKHFANNVPTPRNIGFSTASSKPVAFSAAALQKAKTLFSDISSITEITGTIEQTRNTDVNYEAAQKTSDKINAAGFLKELADKNAVICADSLVSLVPSLQSSSNLEGDPPKVNFLGKSSCSDLNPAEKKTPTYLINDHFVPVTVGRPEDLNKEQSSLLNEELPVHNDCTVTQQRYIAQEAIDCTKALLDDEDLMGQSLPMTIEKQQLQNDPDNIVSVEARRAGKRSVEDADVTGQPPLKRRLLEEFDRSVEIPRRATLQPVKSCPYGVMKDRRVFNYRMPLNANITKPQGNGKMYVEPRLKKTNPQPHSTLGEGGSSGYSVPVFVPPFQKETRTETPNRTPLEKTGASSVFVPPFKRQKTAVQESSAKPQTNDNNCLLYETPPQTNTYIPPTAKAQSTTKVVDNKCNEKMMLASSEVEMEDSIVSVKHLPLDHGTKATSESSAVADGLLGAQAMAQDLQSLQLSRDMQDMRVRKKKRQTIRPLPGHLFLARTSRVDRISLRDAVNGLSPTRYTQKQLYGYGVHQPVCEVTSENAESFRFSCHQFFRREQFINRGGVQLADGGWLIPKNDGTVGKEEFYRALCDTPAVDPKLISEEWVYNHYRWIVWKQACMERSFPLPMGSLCLTPEQILLQLKYRYDVEVDHSRRPALRKIMEKDDTAAKTLVLCVCGVVCWGQNPTRQIRNDGKVSQGPDAKVESPVGIIWLTDGWYAIKAQLDVPLTAMLHRRRLAIGGKLIIHGAELVGSQDACSPLEAPESLMLKICANSSRPAQWDTKLGFHRDPRPFLLPVSSLFSNGGPVGCVDIVILRSYPTQWMEKKPGGGFVFRSTRAEEKEAGRYNSSKHKAMEILFAKIQAEFEKEEKGISKPRSRRQTLKHQDIESLQDGEELHEAVENDSVYLEACLSEKQLETLHAYRRSLAEKRQAELQERYRRAMENAQEQQGSCAKRVVTPVWKLCIADSRDQLGGPVYLLNLWRPSMELQSLLKEGSRYKVYNLTTSEGKKRASSTSLQLTATKKTQFQNLQASQEWLSAHFEPRISARFTDLQNPDFHPLCGEVDLVGYVISILEAQGSSPVLYLADDNLNFVKVRCLSSLIQSGLDDLVKPMELLALCNVHLSAQPQPTPIPLIFAGDLTCFSSNPKETHLQGVVSQLRNLGQGQQNFLRRAEERLAHLIQSSGLNFICSPSVKGTPDLKDRKQDARTCVTSQQQVRSFGSNTPLSRTPASATSSADGNPKSLRKWRGLEYLSRIPSPPPLCPLSTMASPCVNKTFNPPRRSGTPCTFQTPARKSVVLHVDDQWVNDEELAMIDTQTLHSGHGDLGT